MRNRSNIGIIMLLLFSVMLLTACELDPFNQPSDYAKEVITKLKKEAVLEQRDFLGYKDTLSYQRGIRDVTSFYEALTYTPLTEKDVIGYDTALELPLRKALYIGLLSPNSIVDYDGQTGISREALCRLYSEAIHLAGIEENTSLTERVINTLETNSSDNSNKEDARVEDSLYVFGSYFERYKRNYKNLLTGEDLDEAAQHVIRVRVTYKNETSKIINAACFEKDQFISAYHDYKDAVKVELIFSDGSIGSKNLCVLDTNAEADVIVLEYKDSPVKPAKSMTNVDSVAGRSVSMVYNKPDGTVKKGFGYSYLEIPNSINLTLSGITGLNSSGGGLFNSEGELVGMITSELTEEGVIHKAVSMAVLNRLSYDRESFDYFVKERDTLPRKPNLIAITQDGIHYDLRWSNLDSDYYKIYMSINESSFFLLPSQYGEYRFYKGNNQTFTTVPNGRSVQFKAVAVKGDQISEPYISELKHAYDESKSKSYTEVLTEFPELRIKNNSVEVSSIRVYEDGENEIYPYIVNYFISDMDKYLELTEFNPLIPNISVSYGDDYWFKMLNANYRICLTYYGVYSDYAEVEGLLENISDESAEIYYNEALEAYEIYIELIYGESDREGFERVN
ncbi:MAG: hypothetical protein BGO41_09800 [Clostridiales bacterium 38-18]|nr:MAG: hypothetical protein BGO41_09800 [Clostridiales bacterium 38-18]